MNLTRYRTKETLELNQIIIPAGQAISVLEYDTARQMFLIRYKDKEDYISLLEARQKLTPLLF
jgi:hypothetical protein